MSMRFQKVHFRVLERFEKEAGVLKHFSRKDGTEW